MIIVVYVVKNDMEYVVVDRNIIIITIVLNNNDNSNITDIESFL